MFLSCLCLTLITLPIIIICTSQAYSEENGENKNTTTATTKSTNSTSNIHKKTILKNNTDNVTSSQAQYVGYKITLEKPPNTLNVGSYNNKPRKAYSQQISPSDSYSRQISSTSCAAKADLIFIEFIKAFVGETNKYNKLYWQLTNLSCIFVSSLYYLKLVSYSRILT